MKTSTLVSVTILSVGLGAGQVLAQPAAPVKVRVRPTEAGRQITGDLMDFAATLNGDRIYPTAQKWVYGARVGFFGAQEWARDYGSGRWNGGMKVENIVVNDIEGENATATVTYSFLTPGGAGEMPVASRAMFERERNETLQLKLGTIPFGKDKLWQIVPPENLLPGLDADGTGSVWKSSAYFLAQKQPMQGANPKAKRIIQNLKQLAMGVLQFAMDYDEHYAFAPEYLQEALTPYVKSQELFLIPGTRETYSFNANLSDKSIAAVNEVAQTVLLYEGEDEKPIFRYNGRAAIAFADGHVKMVSPDEAKTLIWKP